MNAGKKRRAATRPGQPRRRAILNDAGLLVDAALPGEGIAGTAIDVDPGDLPLDGSYRWDAHRRTFLPAAARRPRATADDVLFALAETIERIEGANLLPVIADWLAFERARRKR